MAVNDVVFVRGTFVHLEVDYPDDISARVSFAPAGGTCAVSIHQGKKALFGNTSFKSGYYDIFQQLHEKLNEMGLEGFPTDPDYVMQRLQNPPAQFKDMGPNGMTVEEYLATLDENGNPR